MTPLLSLGMILAFTQAVYTWFLLFVFGLPLVALMLEMEVS